MGSTAEYDAQDRAVIDPNGARQEAEDDFQRKREQLVHYLNGVRIESKDFKTYAREHMPTEEENERAIAELRESIREGERFAGIGEANSNSSPHSEVACPYCGEVNRDLWEWDSGFNGESHLIECDHCSKPLLLTITKTVEYELAKREG